MWQYLYDTPLQFFTMPWSEYVYQYKTCGQIVSDNFKSNIYSLTGMWLIGISIINSAFYYYYLNYRFGRYYHLKYWFITLLLNSFMVSFFTYFTATSVLDNPNCSVTAHLLSIGLINGIYASITFILLSIGLKRWSPMAKRTPI